MISTLFEIGFITNAKDRADMQDPIWLDKMASGIAIAIDELAKSTDLEGFKS
jgi:N-acetylmuramoyl-L-alanine amidase